MKLVALMLLALTVRETAANCATTEGWTDVNGQCMRCGNGRANFVNAKKTCELQNGFLTSIHNLEQQAFVGSCNRGGFLEAVWIGFYSSNGPPPSITAWADQTPVDYQPPPAEFADNALTDCFAQLPPADTDTWSNAPLCILPLWYACSRPYITCPALGAVLNGTAEYSTEVKASGEYCVETVATYVCDSGFVRTGGNEKRVCRSSGHWDGCSPDCVRTTCGRLSDPENGDVAVTSTTATYSCGDGYRPEGDVDRTCRDNGTWTGTAPTCTEIVGDDLLTNIAIIGAILLGLTLIGAVIAVLFRGRAAPEPTLLPPPPAYRGPRRLVRRLGPAGPPPRPVGLVPALA